MRINSSKIVEKVISLIKEQSDDEIVLTPDEYKKYLIMVSYDGKLLYYIPKFRGKKIVINQKLDLSGLPVKDLGPIVINGGLDISRTKISSLDNVDIRSRGWIADWDTPMRKMRERREFLEKVAQQESKREDGEWDENSELDMIGLCANALFKHLINHYSDYVAKEPGDDEKLEQYKNRIEEIESIDGYNENDDLVTEIETLTEEIEEIEKRIDVYNLYYTGRHYDLLEFSILREDSESDERYAVGDYDMANTTALNRAEDYINDVGINEMDQHFVEDYINETEFKDYFRDGEEEYVRDNIEYIFDEDDFEYSEEVQDRIDEIEVRLEDSEIDSDEEDELREELDELKDSEKTVSEDLIERKVEEMLSDKAYDMMQTLREYGISADEFVNIREMAQGMVDADGFGHTISSYDGNEYEVEFDGDTYYIFRTQ